MPITATCTSCGKSLKVKDELKGKTIRCPGCKATFVAGSAAAGGKSGGPKVGAAPGRTRASTLGQKRQESGGISINPSFVIGVGLLLLLVGGIIAWVVGPNRTHAKWEAMSGDVYDEVESVTVYCLQAQSSTDGGWDSGSILGQPKINNLMIMGPHALSFSLPDKVPFTGVSSEGEFKGFYNPHNKEIELNLGIGGASLSTGIVTAKARNVLKCTGRMIDGKITAEINGKKAEIAPPRKKDDI